MTSLIKIIDHSVTSTFYCVYMCVMEELVTHTTVNTHKSNTDRVITDITSSPAGGVHITQSRMLYPWVMPLVYLHDIIMIWTLFTIVLNVIDK